MSFNPNNFPSISTSVEVQNVVDVSGSIAISSMPNFVVDISGQTVNVGNFPVTQNINIADITSNATLNVKDATLQSYLSHLTFDASNNLETNLNSVNAAFLQNGGLKTYIVNNDVVVSNPYLSSMGFSNGNLNVADGIAQTTLTSIYNNVNTRGFATFKNGSIVANTNSTVIDLQNVPVKCLTIYGHVSSATTLTVFFSNDNTAFYASQYSLVITEAAGSDFGFSLNGCPKYICIQSSNTLTSLLAYLDYS